MIKKEARLELTLKKKEKKRHCCMHECYHKGLIIVSVQSPCCYYQSELNSGSNNVLQFAHSSTKVTLGAEMKA